MRRFLSSLPKIFTLILMLVMLFCFSGGIWAAPGPDPLLFKLGTGKTTGVYYRIDAAKIIQQVDQHYMKFEVVPEKNGTPELIEKVKRNELDGAIVQFDGTLNADPSTFKIVAILHDEYFFMLAKADSKLKSVKDLKPSDTIAIGAGGAALTWMNFCKADKDYANIPTVPNDGAIALSDLTSNKISAVAMSGGLKLGDLLRANSQAGAYKLLSVNDGAFDNMKVGGVKVYEFDKLTSNQYKNLISWGGEKTLKTKAVFIVSTAWMIEHEDAFDRLYDSVVRAIPNIKKELDKE